MKKIIGIVIVILVSGTIYGQSFFDKFENQDGVNCVLVNKKMFQIMGNVNSDTKDKATQQYLSLISKLEDLKFFSTSNKKIALDIKKTAELYLKNSDLKELVNSGNQPEKFKFWFKKDTSEQQFNEVLIYNDNLTIKSETIILSLTGEFTLNDVSFLINKLKINGAEGIISAISKF